MDSSTPAQVAVNLQHMPFQVKIEQNPEAWVCSGILKGKSYFSIDVRD